MRTIKRNLAIAVSFLMVSIILTGCNGNSDSAHDTAHPLDG